MEIFGNGRIMNRRPIHEDFTYSAENPIKSRVVNRLNRLNTFISNSNIKDYYLLGRPIRHAPIGGLNITPYGVYLYFWANLFTLQIGGLK